MDKTAMIAALQQLASQPFDGVQAQAGRGVLMALIGALCSDRAGQLLAHVSTFVRADLDRLNAIDRRN